MYKFLILLFTLPLFFVNCKLRVDTEPTQEISEAIKEKYAPDGRVARWRVRLSSKGQIVVLDGETNLPEAKRAFLDSLRNVGIQYEDNIDLLPQNELGGKTYGVVRLSVCNIRSRAKHSAELSTQAIMGTPLRILKKLEDGEWFTVQTPDGYLGCLDDDGFAPMTEEEFKAWKAADKIFITAAQTFARSEANSNSAVVSDLILGNILKKRGVSGDFIEVEFPDGRIGFVQKDDQVPYEEWMNAPTPTAEKILETAQNFMGHPYLWGGTSAKGFDCSGYTKTVFYKNGIQIPRDASQQVHTGIEIETDTTWKNLLPGDLLFFGQKGEKGEKDKIRHVAIYMGDGKIIHSAGNVKIESLVSGEPNYAENRVKTFIRAKRMLTSLGENGVDLVRELEVYN